MSQLELDFNVATSSGYDADGHLEIQVDIGGFGSIGETQMPFGTLSRPLDPGTPSPFFAPGCSVQWMSIGEQRAAMPMQDPRLVPLLPKVKKGGAMFYGAATSEDGALVGASYALFDGQDPNKQKRGGSFTLASKYGDKAHVFSLNVRTSGKEEISLFHGEGHGLAIDPEGGATLRNKDGSAWMGVNDGGCVIAGNTALQGSLAVGEPAASQPVALADPVILALQAIATALKGLLVAAPAEIAMIQAQIALIKAKHLRTT